MFTCVQLLSLAVVYTHYYITLAIDSNIKMINSRDDFVHNTGLRQAISHMLRVMNIMRLEK